jgi:hypothetical protein
LNFLDGNGSALSALANGSPDNFGVGLVGTSSGNIIERNKIGGNVNGVYIAAGAGSKGSNEIRHNTIDGNPPVLVPQVPGAQQGADIQDLSPPGSNSFEKNYCLTYSGASPSPCPALKVPAGHGATEAKGGTR